MPTELASSNTDLSLNVNQEKAPLNRYGNSMTETIPAITSINIKDTNSNTGKLIASTTKGATANQSNAAMESKTEVPAISNETALITPSISSNSTTSSIPSSVKSMHNKTTEKDKSNSTSSSDDNNATSSNALPNIIMSHDLFSIVLERAATRKNPSAPASRRQSGHFSSSASSVRSVRWSTDVAPASAHKLTRQNSWSAADAHKLRQSNKTTAIEGSLSKEAPATYNNGAVKRGSVIPAAAAASASSPTSPIRGILMAPAPGSRRPSLTNATNQLSRNNSPRPSISHARPQSLYAVPHVTDDAQAKFLKVTDGLTFRYHPSQPLGGPGHFGRVYLGVNIDDPSDLVAIKFPHTTEEENLKVMRRAGLFGHRKGHEARALRRMGMLRGEVPLGDGRDALVMDYVAGLEPQELVDQGLITSEARLRKLAIKTRHAVTRAIHRRGMAHSDVHAGNIRYRVEPKIPWWKRYTCFLRRLPGPLSGLGGPTNTYAESTSGASDSDGLFGFGFPITPATTQEGSNSGLGLAMFSTRNSIRSLFGGRRSSNGRGNGFADGPAGTMEPGDITSQRPDAPAAVSYTFTPQFIDFGMARFLSELSQSEAAHAVEADRQRAFDAIWTQRHRLPRERRSSAGKPSGSNTLNSRQNNGGAQTASNKFLTTAAAATTGLALSATTSKRATGNNSTKHTGNVTTRTITRVGAARKLD